MKRKLLLPINIAGFILVLLVGVTGTMSYSAFIQNLTESVTSAGVIGEADGPTAIFISGDLDLNTIKLLLLLSLLLLLVFFYPTSSI